MFVDDELISGAHSVIDVYRDGIILCLIRDVFFRRRMSIHISMKDLAA